MATDIFELNCPFCDKLYKLPREKVVKHVGKSIHCRKCGKPFSIPALPPEEPAEQVIDEVPEPIAATAPVAMEERAPVAEVSETDAAESYASSSAPLPPPPPAEEYEPEPQVQTYTADAPFASREPVEPPAAEEMSVNAAESITEDAPAEYTSAEHTVEEHEETAAIHVEYPVDEPAGEAAPEAAPEAAEHSIAEPPAELPVDFIGEDRPLPVELPVVAPAAEAWDEPPPFPASVSPITEELSSTDEPIETAHENRLEDEAKFSSINEPAPYEASEDAAPADDVMKPIELSADPPEMFATEPPPPLLPPVPPVVPPAPAPPRRLKRARVAVSPVFDQASEEEDKPRQRGRLTEDVDMETMDRSISASELSSSLAQIPAMKTVASEDGGEDVFPDPTRSAALEQASASEEEPDATPELIQQTAGDGERQLLPAPDAVVRDLSAIRRFVALLAIMSVVVALVLVAILLTLMGIIPKK